MISNAAFIPLDDKKIVLNRMLECIQECAVAEEEYITFGMLTDDIPYVTKLSKQLERLHYQVEQSCVHTVVEDEIQTVCFIKVKWHKERFGFNENRPHYVS